MDRSSACAISAVFRRILLPASESSGPVHVVGSAGLAAVELELVYCPAHSPTAGLGCAIGTSHEHAAVEATVESEAAVGARDSCLAFALGV